MGAVNGAVGDGVVAVPVGATAVVQAVTKRAATAAIQPWASMNLRPGLRDHPESGANGVSIRTQRPDCHMGPVAGVAASRLAARRSRSP